MLKEQETLQYTPFILHVTTLMGLYVTLHLISYLLLFYAALHAKRTE